MPYGTDIWPDFTDSFDTATEALIKAKVANKRAKTKRTKALMNYLKVFLVKRK